METHVAFHMSDDGTFFWGMIFGAFGMGYFVYGKGQSNFVLMIIGALLCVFPYVVSGLWPTVGVGAALTLLPWFLRREG
jgi:hypothetical protein